MNLSMTRKTLTEHNYMPYPNVLKRSATLINKDIIQLVECIKTLNHMSEDSMPTIQVLKVVRQSNEELRTASSSVRCHSHAHSTLVHMLEFWSHFRLEVSRYGGFRASVVYVRPDGFAACACCGGVADLSEKVFGHCN